MNVLSKTKSVPRLIRWSVTIIFLEVLAYIWFKAWSIDRLVYIESGIGYVLTVEDRLAVILAYVKALFQAAVLALILVVGWFFTKPKQG